ncbi:MAG: phage tail family protein [Turicibacter sp.]|nr:phage tail family protein [Turicibacter sp.]
MTFSRQNNGFFFADKHSSEFNMAVESVMRGLLPPKKAESQGFDVTGRHGNVVYNSPVFGIRQIIINVAFLDEDVFSLQKKARAVAHWLGGSEGLLYFDDEPDLAYNATIFEPVDAEEIITAKRATLNFTAQPFARSINFFQSNHNAVRSGVRMDVYTNGTQRAPCIIMLRNAGGSNITAVKFTRKAFHR